MTVFLVRRIAGAIVLLTIISFLMFGMLLAAPGSPERVLLGHRPADPEVQKEIRREYHLDKSFIAQYGYWAWDTVHLRLGRSIVNSQKVSEQITSRLPVTLFIGVYTFILSMFIGLTGGILAGIKRNSIFARGIAGVSMVGWTAPTFAVAIFLLYFGAVKLGWFPVFGPGEGFVDRLWHLTLPVIAIAIGNTALVITFTRTALAGALADDYVAAARARGLGRTRVLFGHAFRNAAIPILTTAGLIFQGVIVGSVFVETTFSLPGVGTLFIDAVKKQDIPMVQALGMLTAFVIVATNLATDVFYMLVDPRIRFDRSTV